MAQITTQCITKMDDWLSLSSDWSDFLVKSNDSTFFLSWEWLYSWAEICLGEDRQLFIVTFYEKGLLVGLAPFYILKRKSGLLFVKELRFLGTPEAGTDYLDVIIQKGREYEVANTLYDYLHGEGRSCWDQLQLSDIRSDSLFLLHFMNRLDEEGRYAELQRCAYCPGTQLPDGETGFESMLSPSWRKTFKRAMRVSDRDHEVSHVVFNGSDVEEQLELFFQLYEAKAGHPREPLHSILKKVIGKCAENAPLQLDNLFLDGVLVAALLSFKHKQTVSSYLIAVDKQYNPKISIGGLLYGSSIKNSIAAGFKYYDFLKGDELYKFHWSNSGQSTLKLNVWQKCPAGYCLALGKLTRSFGKLLLR